MNEFKFWMIIVSLLIFCIMMLSLVVVHIEKRIKTLDAIAYRLEEKEKKREKPRLDPKPDSSDGL